MLIVEIDIKMKTCWKVAKGTYKINTKLIDGINICEFISDLVLYEGYAEIIDEADIKIITYELYDLEDHSSNYSEYVLPNSRFADNWTSITYNESYKYWAFSYLNRAYNAGKETCDAFGINKCMIIYGPPGVGKSTFTKALCQKLAIRNNKKMHLREINCNRILSRFYGESIKNLANLLDCESKDTVIVLDEADSILLDRGSIINKNEPNDSVRIINSLLSFIDRGRNFIILISNFKDQLDSAILDRCDILVEMEKLSLQLTYNLLKNTLEKMMDMGYLEHYQFMEFLNVEICGEMADERSWSLFNIAAKNLQKSPRQIKKLMFGLLGDGKQSIGEVLKGLANISK